jgi:two-component system, chemotaxis family, sensor kinase CheA
MDVVKRELERMGGALDIHSVQGQGTRFSMRVPLTLAVIDGMVTRLGTNRYVIPTLSVVRLLEPDARRVHTLFDGGALLTVSDRSVPILPLEALFGLPPSTAKRRLAVVVESEGARVALLIDELLGQQQVVIKNLGEGLGEIAGVSGCAIMSDGRVGLVLDIAGLLALARTAAQRSSAAANKTTVQQQSGSPTTESKWMS